jgi:hypothetical protein
MRYTPILEWQPLGLPMSVDIMVRGVDMHGAVCTVAFEVDGPTHYTPDGRDRTMASTTRDAVLLLNDIYVRTPPPCHALTVDGACPNQRLSRAPLLVSHR